MMLEEFKKIFEDSARNALFAREHIAVHSDQIDIEIRRVVEELFEQPEGVPVLSTRPDDNYDIDGLVRQLSANGETRVGIVKALRALRTDWGLKESVEYLRQTFPSIT